MARIAPFSGIHYNSDALPIADLIAPPYDVLSPAQQDALYAAHPLNVVRIILNREEPTDDDRDNRYIRAAEFLREQLKQGVLVRDESPALYEYVQIFEHPLNPEHLVERHTLFVALKLEPYSNGVVLPHEETHPKAKADRLNVMRATHANPEPIYGLYEDPNARAAEILDRSRAALEPLIHARVPTANSTKNISNGEQHIIYRHVDSEVVAELQKFFEPKRVWIADGHHRYETALNYQAEYLTSHPNATGDERPEDFIFIGLSAFEDPGLVVLPTHRLVKNVPAERLDQLTLHLQRYFHIEPMSVPAVREWIKREVVSEKRFGILASKTAYALSLRDLAQAESALDSSHCDAWRRLDVTILQGLVLDRSLGISWADLAHTPNVAYTRDEEEAVQKVLMGEFQLACLLQNPTVTEVRDVAAAGDKMPQKSTFFYPKLWSGLLLRSLETI